MRTQPKLKTYDHATVIHALKMFKVYKTYREEYFDTLESYFDISPDADYKELPKLERLLNQYKEIKSKYNIASNKIKKYEEQLNEVKELRRKIKSGFTENEILYRDLNKTQMKIYDERAELILKSFEWQKPKNEYEIINCAS
jgi:predicted RNase H-like nuclease (RuvC/YqgF family)